MINDGDNLVQLLSQGVKWCQITGDVHHISSNDLKYSFLIHIISALSIMNNSAKLFVFHFI